MSHSLSGFLIFILLPHFAQFSYHQNIATYYGAFVQKGDGGQEDQLWVSRLHRNDIMVNGHGHVI